MRYLLTTTLCAIPVFFSGAGYVSKKFNLPLLLRATIGSLLVCLLVSPVLFYNVRAIKFLLIIFILLGYVLLLIENKKNLKRISWKKFLISFKNKTNTIILFLFYSFLISALFYDFFPLNYIYIEHDLLYWSWPSEIYKANYDGGLRSEIAWPMQFTSYHVLPGMLLAYLNIFSPIQTMVGILLQKYLILISVPAVILTALSKSGFRYIIKTIVCFSIPVLIFRDEISYSVSISNYLIVYLILICFWVMFQGNQALKLPTITLLFFLMIFSKLIIFPIAFCIFILYFAKAKKFFTKIERGLMLLVFLSNLYIWGFIKRPLDSSSINFFDLFDLKYLGSMRQIVDWVIDPNLVNLQFPFRYYFSFFIVLFVLIKVFLVFYFSINKILNNLIRLEHKIVFGDNLDSYYLTWYGFMLLALLELIFFRTSSSNEIKHAAHLLYICSVITVIITGIMLSKLLKSKMSFFFTAFILMVLGLVSPYKMDNDVSFFSPKHKLGNTSLVIKSIDQGTFIIQNEAESHVQKQIKSSILGTRIECTVLADEKLLSPIYLFLYLPNNENC
jgi:hypothetical protein